MLCLSRQVGTTYCTNHLYCSPSRYTFVLFHYDCSIRSSHWRCRILHGGSTRGTYPQLCRFQFSIDIQRTQMVFVNKIVLNSTPNLPTLFMFFQSMMTVILLKFTSIFTSHVKIPQFNLSTPKKLAPLIFIDAAGFIFNALCLRDVEAAFYQIARGLVLPLTIAIVSISSSTRPALPVICCAAIVTLGFFFGTSIPQDLPEHAIPSPLGLLYGFLASLSIAFHAVLIKSSLPHVGGSSTMLSYWSNLGAGVLLGTLAILNGEAFEFWRMVQGRAWDWNTFLWGNLVTGVFGFLISVAGILSVKVTSPVTHMFSSVSAHLYLTPRIC